MNMNWHSWPDERSLTMKDTRLVPACDRGMGIPAL